MLDRDCRSAPGSIYINQRLTENHLIARPSAHLATCMMVSDVHHLSLFLCLQVYSVQDSPLCLTGTAEVPLGAMYMDQILAEEQLPIKMAGFGHCFRTEAGAGGETAGRA